MVFVGFNQTVKKSDSTTKVSHIFGFRIKSQDFQNLAFLGFLGFSQVFAHFASNTLVFLVFSSFFDGLEQKLKKSDGKTKFSHISGIRVRFQDFLNLGYIFIYIYIYIYIYINKLFPLPSFGLSSSHVAKFTKNEQSSTPILQRFERNPGVVGKNTLET